MPRGDRCAIPRCPRPPVLIYLNRWPICETHWGGHGERHHLLVKLGRVPEDFQERLGRLRRLLRRGSDEDVRCQGPAITGKIAIEVFRPYLKDELAARLPLAWKGPPAPSTD